jgi:hypothetical protein
MISYETITLTNRIRTVFIDSVETVDFSLKYSKLWGLKKPKLVNYPADVGGKLGLPEFFHDAQQGTLYPDCEKLP